MKARLTLALCLFIALALHAQNNPEIGSNPLALDKKWIFSQDSFPSSIRVSDSIPRPTLADIKLSTGIDFSKPMFKSDIINLKVPRFAPVYDYSANIYSITPINSRSWISTARINSNYIGLGGLSSAGMQYNLHINDFMTYSGGVTLSKFNIYNNFNNNINLNSNFRFQIFDRIFINVFGNYSSPGNQDTKLFRSLDSSMFPQTNYGGSFDFKVTDKWGIITGAEREFDPFRGKWVTRPFILPVFYGH